MRYNDLMKNFLNERNECKNYNQGSNRGADDRLRDGNNQSRKVTNVCTEGAKVFEMTPSGIIE